MWIIYVIFVLNWVHMNIYEFIYIIWHKIDIWIINITSVQNWVHMNIMNSYMSYDIYDSYLNKKFHICIWTFMNSFMSSVTFYCSTTDEMLVVTSGSKLINFYILIVCLFSVSPFVYFSILFEFISGLFHCSYLFKSFKYICWMDGFAPPPLGRISI